MKRSTGLSSRMSNYDYAGKKSTWKWTPAKIAAFSMFGLMIGTIIFMESNSNRNSFETPVLVIEEPSFSIETSDFDKEYQDFLKRGKKIVNEETLDSIRQINTSATIRPPENNTPNLNNQPSKTPPEPIKKTPAPVHLPVQTPDVTAENNFELIEITPLVNNNTSSLNSGQNTNTIQEPTIKSSNNLTTSTSDNLQVAKAGVDDDKSITEEFYIEETITGTIAAAADRVPIQGVTVTVKGTNRKAVSDSNGRYSITVPGDPQHRTLQYLFRGNVTERDVSPGTDVINVRF